MRHPYFTLGILVLLSGCKAKLPVTELKLTGAWRSINTHKKGYPPDDIIIYKRGEQLYLTTYYGHHEAQLNTTGDSITLRQGCLVYLSPIALHSMPNKNPDSLSVAMFGKYTRMDSTTFVENYLNYKHLYTRTHSTNKTKR